jgi:hypothetical protein
MSEHKQRGPFAFAAAEAMSQGAQVGIVAWEAGGTLHYRVVPDGSLAVLIGLHDLLGLAIDVVRDSGEADDDDEADS